MLSLESNLFDLVGVKLQALGHRVVSVNGEDMGGLQAIWLCLIVTWAAPAAASAEQPIAGVYRAASDHRKDGEAVGW